MSNIDWQFEERLSGGASDQRDPDAEVPKVTPATPLISRPMADVETVFDDVSE